MTDRELLIALTRAVDILANVATGEDERTVWLREVHPALEAAQDHLLAASAPGEAPAPAMCGQPVGEGWEEFPCTLPPGHGGGHATELRLAPAQPGEAQTGCPQGIHAIDATSNTRPSVCVLCGMLWRDDGQGWRREEGR